MREAEEGACDTCVNVICVGVVWLHRDYARLKRNMPPGRVVCHLQCRRPYQCTAALQPPTVLTSCLQVNAANNAIEYLPLALLNAWHPSIDESIVRSGPHLIASYVAGHSDAPYNAAAGSSSGTDAMVDGATEDDRAAAGDDSDDLVLELPGHDNGVAEDGTSPAADEASDGDSGGDVASPSSPAGDGDGGAASSSSPTSSPAAHNLAGSFATPAKKLKAFIPRGAGACVVTPTCCGRVGGELLLTRRGKIVALVAAVRGILCGRIAPGTCQSTLVTTR